MPPSIPELAVTVKHHDSDIRELKESVGAIKEGIDELKLDAARRDGENARQGQANVRLQIFSTLASTIVVALLTLLGVWVANRDKPENTIPTPTYVPPSLSQEEWEQIKLARARHGYKLGGRPAEAEPPTPSGP